jgi:hypothetical protein
LTEEYKIRIPCEVFSGQVCTIQYAQIKGEKQQC